MERGPWMLLSLLAVVPATSPVRTVLRGLTVLPSSRSATGEVQLALGVSMVGWLLSA